jgi:hypothetical protein
MPEKYCCFDTANYSVIKEITVGALPDMITSPGKFHHDC